VYKLAAIRRYLEKLERFHFNGTGPFFTLHLDYYEISLGDTDQIPGTETGPASRDAIASRLEDCSRLVLGSTSLGFAVQRLLE
jgi:hypothetical protein